MPKRKIATVAVAAVLMATAACERTDNEPGPGGVTVGEAKALDDAAEMLESRDGTVDADAEKAPADEGHLSK